MKRPLVTLSALVSSRALTPLVIGVFLLFYIGIAFFNDDTLITLMEMTKRNFLLLVLLALILLNTLARVAFEFGRFRRRRKMFGRGEFAAGIFQEEITIPGRVVSNGLEGFLRAAGYKSRRTSDRISAWRGISNFPARVFFLIGVFCLFAGILTSLVTRVSHREALIEGEPLPKSFGGGGVVKKIDLRKKTGFFLEQSLSVLLLTDDKKEEYFGLYPPSSHNGSFFYLRFLGIAPQVRFNAPDLPDGYATYLILMIYPPGKEDSADIPGTAYRIEFRLESPADGGDPFVTGKMSLKFRFLRGGKFQFDGIVPIGGEFRRGGYSLAFPDFRRYVATDLVRDWGVWLIWMAFGLFVFAFLFWLPVRLFFPRQEILLLEEGDCLIACSSAEGRALRHAGVFHELLDKLERELITDC